MGRATAAGEVICSAHQRVQAALQGEIEMVCTAVAGVQAFHTALCQARDAATSVIKLYDMHVNARMQQVFSITRLIEVDAAEAPHAHGDLLDACAAYMPKHSLQPIDHHLSKPISKTGLDDVAIKTVLSKCPFLTAFLPIAASRACSSTVHVAVAPVLELVGEHSTSTLARLAEDLQFGEGGGRGSYEAESPSSSDKRHTGGSSNGGSRLPSGGTENSGSVQPCQKQAQREDEAPSPLPVCFKSMGDPCQRSYIAHFPVAFAHPHCHTGTASGRHCCQV